jgi:hypothetical protein
MGEKETMTAADAAAASGRLNVSATPGGSEGAGILSAAVSSVSDLADDGDGSSDDRKGPNAVNVKLA